MTRHDSAYIEPAERYPVEVLGPDDDDGTMPTNVAELAEQVVGHRIVDAYRVGPNSMPYRTSKARGYYGDQELNGFVIKLDTGKEVMLLDNGDCCAYTDLDAFLLNAAAVDHVITGIGTTEGFTTWHVYADMGDVLNLTVGWSPGNPFYYGYGFDIRVMETDES